jgi:dynein heavy chain
LANNPEKLMKLNFKKPTKA